MRPVRTSGWWIFATGNRPVGRLCRATVDQKVAWLDTWEAYQTAPALYQKVSRGQIYKSPKWEIKDIHPKLRPYFKRPINIFRGDLWYDTGTLLT